MSGPSVRLTVAVTPLDSRIFWNALTCCLVEGRSPLSVTALSGIRLTCAGRPCSSAASFFAYHGRSLTPSIIVYS